MLFAIHCIDKPGVLEKRMQVMQAHRDYLDNSAITVVMSGPLVDDDDEAKVIGSLYVVEAADRAAIDAFQKDDPLFQANIWETVNVQGFVKRVG